MFRFANPEFLLLLLIIPFIIWWYVRKSRRMSGALRYSKVDVFKRIKKSSKRSYRHFLFALRLLVLGLLIFCFARPQAGQTETEVVTEGIDIILAIDVSSSMLAEDFQPKNRLQAVKLVAGDFIKGRTNDRIGLVVFSGQSFTQCPLTLDYGILLRFLDQVKIGMIEDGTAIGMAIATCVNRLRNSEAKSKVVILLTDGRNNRGELDPVTAARIAQTFDIRIYTIGAGKKGYAMYPIDDPVFGKHYRRMPVQIDEELLKKVADLTEGHYFRATDENSLESIYEEISDMEKTKIEVKEYTRYRELFVHYLLLALGLLLLEVIVANTWLRKIP